MQACTGSTSEQNARLDQQRKSKGKTASYCQLPAESKAIGLATASIVKTWGPALSGESRPASILRQSDLQRWHLMECQACRWLCNARRMAE